jgi:hypothetical protein
MYLNNLDISNNEVDLKTAANINGENNIYKIYHQGSDFIAFATYYFI